MNAYSSVAARGDAVRPGAAASDPTPFLEVDRASVQYGSTKVLSELSLGVTRGEFVALLGSSGCGKTTLLRTIAGFMMPTSGAIRVGGREVTRQPPDKRGMALVFQSYALWPHMTVARNIGYGLKLRGRSRQEIAARVTEMQALLGLEGLGERKPAELSGGQRQRVALGRALAISPDILLLDEPLSNLDARIRLTVRHEISALQKRLGITAIHVTHDREEAMVMADRIVILDAGRIAQIGTPQEVYNRPSSSFVAAFMGAENVVPLLVEAGGERLRIAAGPVNRAASIPADGRRLGGQVVEARFRSEAAELHAASEFPKDQATEGALVLDGVVAQASYPGGVWRHVVKIGDASVVVDSSHAFASGEAVSVKVPAGGLFLFDATDCRKGGEELR
ncbi:MAG: ABC transporter ATP-binding protein [Rhizobiaceae bacterium]|jgi:ABC-type Fe3+/spermidine/putrescine transport system ATPase subunit